MNEFEHNTTSGRSSLVAEFWDFVKQSKKWWMLPILTVILLLGAFVLIGGTVAGPFIYALF